VSINNKQSIWIDLFFNPIAYLRKNWIIESDKMMTIFILILAGTSNAIDDIMWKVVNYNILENIIAEISDKALFSWWIYWLYVIINSSIKGLVIWVIGGWWFNIRLGFSGDNKSDIKKCRSIVVYLNMIKSLPVFMLIIISTIFFQDIYSTYSNEFIQILYAILFNSMIITLIYFEYRIAFEKFDVDKKRVKIWFIYIPSVLFILNIGFYINGIVK